MEQNIRSSAPAVRLASGVSPRRGVPESKWAEADGNVQHLPRRGPSYSLLGAASSRRPQPVSGSGKGQLESHATFGLWATWEGNILNYPAWGIRPITNVVSFRPAACASLISDERYSPVANLAARRDALMINRLGLPILALQLCRRMSRHDMLSVMRVIGAACLVRFILNLQDCRPSLQLSPLGNYPPSPPTPCCWQAALLDQLNTPIEGVQWGCGTSCVLLDSRFRSFRAKEAFTSTVVSS